MNIEPQTGGGGWMSGPMTTVPHRDMPDLEPTGSEIEAGIARHAADRRPEYSPSALVLDVQAALAAVGVTVNPAPSQLHVASLAAADLLRALGVRPASVPIRGRWSFDPPESPEPSGRANPKEQ